MAVSVSDSAEPLPYTENGNERSSTDMLIGLRKYITQTTIQRVMQSGFALVLLLLGAACVIALRGTRAIQTDAESIAREELTIARLLNEVQAEEMTMTAVLHRLIDGTRAPDSATLLRELSEADQAITRAAAAARTSPEAAQWMRLEQTAKQFTAAARQAIQLADQSEPTRRNLFAIHHDVLALVQGLVASSAQRAIHMDGLLAGRSKELADESLMLLGNCFVLALLCAVLTIRITRDSVKQVEDQASELGRVSWHMLQTQEESARRFSHELHDELGQSLAAIRANLAAVGPTDFEARRSDCLHLVDEAIANVRELSQLLRPVILDDFGLDAALRWLTDKFAQRTNIDVRYESNLLVRLDEQHETHLFRIAQEALTNVARHSQATIVNVSLKAENGAVSLTIEDNGRGLPGDDQTTRASLGMVGMRARARQVGAELTVSSRGRTGVRVQVEIPQKKLSYAS